ncbi:cyclic peptide export ABC transporter [Marinobacter sp. DUT-3]|uniref:cyclic peptide export ABC transporter n=1 Tax=unclassified Marinobacter TaxID=83889 RepID=UPI00387B76EB
MTLMMTFLRQVRWRIALAVLASSISAAAGIGLIAYINQTLDTGMADTGQSLALFAGLVVLVFVSGVSSQVLLVRLGHSLVYQLRLKLVAQVLGTSLARLEALGGPLVYNVLTRDVTMVAAAFKQLPISLYNGLLLVAGMAYLAWLNLPLFLVTQVVIALGVWGDILLGRLVKRLMGRVRDLDDTLFEHFEATIEGRNELGLSRSRRRYLFQRRLEPTARESMQAASRADALWAINLNWTTVLVFLLLGAVFFAGMGWGLVSRDVLVGYVLAIMFLRTPIAMILDAVPAIIRGNVALRAIDRLGLGPAEDFSEADEREPLPPFQELCLEGAGYRYPGQGDEAGFHLGPLDLHIRRGELIFLVGGNGSGKSTLGKLMTGLYLPTEGRLTLNGETLDETTAARHRGYFATIFPDFYLFADVLDAEGRDAGVDERVQHYLRRLALDHKVEVRDGRLSTTALSQGQRKRLALLLLYMEDRPVLLLDEWAADQDPTFREVFYREILPELQAAGKTVVAITHDDRYFALADRVYKLDSGQLVPYNAPPDSSPHPPELSPQELRERVTEQPGT